MGVRVFVQVGLAEGRIRAAEVAAHLLHHLLIKNVLGASEGHRHPSAAHLSVLENEVGFYLLLDDVALGGVVVMLAALQSMDLDGLAETSLVDLTLQLVVKLQVWDSLMDGLHEFLAVDVVSRGKVGRDGEEFNGSYGDDRRISVAIIRYLIF